MDVSVGAVAARLKAEVLGNTDRVLADAQPLSKAGATSLSFFADESKIRLLDETQAGAILISRSRVAELTDQHKAAHTFIVVDQALDAFIAFLQAERPARPRKNVGCSPQACIAESATIGESTNIFPGAHIGEDVVIGEHCDIHPGVVIGAGCRIGNHVTMYPNVVLYHDLSIGNNVIIHANTVIGADGFGYQLKNGRLEKIPHLGSVRIEDHVEIGACATIDRGMIGPTVVGTGTKIDNLVMIAHNCEIGRHNAFASQTGFAGSCTTGDYVRAGGQAGIGDHLTIGNGVSLAASIALHSNVPDGETWGGYPARPLDESIKIMMTQSRLPEMRNRLRDLEKQVNALTQQLQSSSVKDAA